MYIYIGQFTLVRYVPNLFVPFHSAKYYNICFKMSLHLNVLFCSYTNQTSRLRPAFCARMFCHKCMIRPEHVRLSVTTDNMCLRVSLCDHSLSNHSTLKYCFYLKTSKQHIFVHMMNKEILVRL